jgi:hypothetical protein
MKTLTRFLLLLSVTLTLAGCFGTNEAEKARGEFIKGCLDAGMNKDQCSCSYDKLEATYGKERMVSFEKHPESVPDRLTFDTMNAMRVCTGQAPLTYMGSAISPAAPAPEAPAAAPPPAAAPAQAPLDGSQDYTRFEQGPNGTVQMKAPDASPAAQAAAPAGPATAAAPQAPAGAAPAATPPAAVPPNSL